MEPLVKIGTQLSIGTVKYFKTTREGKSLTVLVGIETNGVVVELYSSEVENLLGDK